MPVRRTLLPSTIRRTLRVNSGAFGGGGSLGIRYIATASAQAGYNVDPLVVSSPAGAEEGDLLVLTVATERSAITAITGGWTKEVHWEVDVDGIATEDDPTGLKQFAVWTRIVGASEPGSYSLTIDPINASAGQIVAVHAFRGVDVLQSYAKTDASVVSPSMTAEANDVLLCWQTSLGSGLDQPSLAAPAGMDLRVNRWLDTSADTTLRTATQFDLAAGATGTKDWSATETQYEFAGSLLLRRVA